MTEVLHPDTDGLGEDGSADDGDDSIGQIDRYALQGAAKTTSAKIALKHGDTFLVADPRGDQNEDEQESGLFWHNTRFLRICALFLAGMPLIDLSHSVADEGDTCQIDLCNAFFPLDDAPVPQGTIHVRRDLRLTGHRLVETITLTNFDQRTIHTTLGLRLDADFSDIFEIRGMTRAERGEVLPVSFDRKRVQFRYRGRDDVVRQTAVRFEPAASSIFARGIFWKLRLQGGTPLTITITIDLDETGDPRFTATLLEDAGESGARLPEADVRGANAFFNRLMTRSKHDLGMMCTLTPTGIFPYGGIPWYVCPFGRDGLITSLEFLPWFPEVARGTLAFLADYQGTKIDAFTDEEPGKILHEFRRGEMANCREIPFIPYYGTVDATPLFLILLEHYIRWSDDRAFLAAMWPHAVAAARWLREYGDRDGDGLIEYRCATDTGLRNQGWKDSWDAISHADGTLAESPIALCEAQGYAFAAYQAMSYLAGRLGHAGETAQWLRQADELQKAFIERFWWPAEDCIYLALDADKRPCAVVSSNAGQCLWTGIVPDEWADPLMRRLLREDMYTGWGIRTLSSGATRYNPMSYHNGSVWPHDTALVGAGFARYGFKREAANLLGNLYGISLYQERARLPELICGFGRTPTYGPTHYPVACAPQSWSAGAPYLLVSAVLGLAPDAEHKLLQLRYPELPGDWLEDLDLYGVRLGGSTVNLHVARSHQATAVNLIGESDIELHIITH